MKTPLAWISLYSPLNSLLEKSSLKELAHEYSIHTAEIDGIEDHFLESVVIGKVLSCTKHPESKKLSIVEVQVGKTETTTILTGAANIVDATYVPVALVGAVLPGDFVIGERMMAGMMSRGMICSDDELGLATERSEGIMILEQYWETALLEKNIGESFFHLELPFPGIGGAVYSYRLKDATFEIDNKFITNRPDLFSVVGNAREWHTVFGTPFAPYIPREEKLPGGFPLKIDTEACLAYNAWKMESIEVGKSPWGIALMMERSGLSPKMDIVDITNCIMTELGQPMHAFDADRVHGGIIVRMAKPGETLLALNGVEYKLTPEDMVIADDIGPIAIAGVIGGMESAVSLETKNIIWESATFDPVSVRLTAQRYAIRTDASTRYEKSLDPLLANTTLSRIMDYMRFLGKEAKVTASAQYLNEKKIKNIDISLDQTFIEKKIGAYIEPAEIKKILTNLGFEILSDSSETFTLRVPSYRATKDISIKEDIVEEIGRVYGYDKVPLTPLGANFTIGTKNREKELRDQTLRFFEGKNWNEVYNYSFSNTPLENKLLQGKTDDAIAIRNAFNEEYTHMRQTLAGRLLLNIHDNVRHDDHLKFFEIGNIYKKDTPRSESSEKLLSSLKNKPFSEKKIIAGAAYNCSIELIRKDLEEFLQATIGTKLPIYQEKGSERTFLHPGASGEYRVGEDIVITFGIIHPAVLENFEIEGSVVYFEIDFDLLLGLHREMEVRFQEISRFQTISRELNFVVDEHTRTGEMGSHLEAIHPWISNVRVDSLYRDDEKIGKGKKSVSFAFELINLLDTISDKDAQNVQDMIIARMSELGYTLRS